MLDVSDIKIV